MTLISDVRKLDADAKELYAQVDGVRAVIARHEEQISGDRGLSAAINVLSEEVKSLKRAIWTTGGGIVLAAVGFGFAVMQVAGTP